MKLLTSSVFAGLVAFALAAPATARPLQGPDVPSCGDGKEEKKDEKKNPSTLCGDGKEEKKDEKKNPSATPSCGDGKEEKKDEKKNPS